MEDSVFTKILNGQLPSHKVYEDDKTLAFLEIYPKTNGHTLVIPKTGAQFVWDLDDEDYYALMKTVKKIAKRLKQVLGTKYVGAEVIGVHVPYAHIHLIPFNESNEYRRIPDESIDPDQAKLAEIAKKLYFKET